jgi:membrane protein involved in colicin uptake
MPDDVQETTEATTDETTEQRPEAKPDDKGQDPDHDKAELARARSEAAKYRVDAQKWRAHEEAQMSAADKAEKAKAEAEAKLATIELERDRAKVALKYKLDDELAEVLAGSTREELEANAAKLAKRISTGKPDLMPGARGKPVAGAKSDVDDLIRRS